jgi:hypothetical protein
MQSARFCFWGLATILSLLLCGSVDIVVVQNLRVPNVISKLDRDKSRSPLTS